MKKIIAIILIISTFAFIFTGCTATKPQDINPVEYEETIVDVSAIAENKLLFASRVPSTDEQAGFKQNVLNLIESIEKNEIGDFMVTFSSETFSSWEECNNYAEAMEPAKSHLGSYNHYVLWFAQRIINNEVSWEDACDKIYPRTTIAFSEANTWSGSCTTRCLFNSYAQIGEVNAYLQSDHAFNNHRMWQAFVVTLVK